MNDATYDGPHYLCGACSTANHHLCRDSGCACCGRKKGER